MPEAALMRRRLRWDSSFCVTSMPVARCSPASTIPITQKRLPRTSR
jgi:hypothetical protein